MTQTIETKPLTERAKIHINHLRAMRRQEEAEIAEYSLAGDWTGTVNHHARLRMIRKLAVKEWRVARTGRA